MEWYEVKHTRGYLVTDRHGHYELRMTYEQYKYLREHTDAYSHQLFGAIRDCVPYELYKLQERWLDEVCK